MQSFVILLHIGNGREHYDLMIADGESLATWQLACDPSTMAIGASITAGSLPPHRAAYLDYEGPVSRGRGSVRRIDRGTYETIARTADAWRFRLAGEKNSGNYELQRLAENWSLTRLAFGPGDSPYRNMSDAV